MEVLFRNILEISIMASFLIVAVLLIRTCFKKASASFSCVLWMLVGIRLLVPVSISSPFGLVPDVDLAYVEQGDSDTLGDLSVPDSELDWNVNGAGTGSDAVGSGLLEGITVGNAATGNGAGNGNIGNMAGEINPAGPTSGGASQATVGSQNQGMSTGQVPGIDGGNGGTYLPTADSENEGVAEGQGSADESMQQGIGQADETQDAGGKATYVWSIAAVVWLVGTCLMLGYMLISWLKLRRSLREALPEYVSCGDNPVKVYRHDSVDSPFLLGVISPKIYVPLGLSGQDLQFVLAHEQMHLRRRDHWLKPLSFIVLALYWFHPFVWVAYILLGRDIELACDERVLQENPKLERAAYAKALLSCAVKQRRIAVCPVAFGEVDVKERVTKVLNYKKPGFWIMFVCVLLGVLVVLMFMTVSGDEESLPAGTEDVQEGDGPDEDGEGGDATGNSEQDSDTQGDGTGHAAVGEQVPTQERIAKYQMYYDVIGSFVGDEGERTWDFVTSKLIYERSRWFADYNGEKLQRIAAKEEQYMASLIPDIIYYRADEGEMPEEFVLKMLDAMIAPLTIPSENRSYTIKEYAIRDQKLIQVGDGIWLLPGIDGYYDFEGVDFITMADYVASESEFMWNNLMPFVAQGSFSCFYYLLIEEDNVFRLQRADDMMKLDDEYAMAVEGEPENELIFYYPVNSLNAPDYIPPKEHELIAPDCFWAGSGKVFIDDTANDRILVYQNGSYEKSIALPWEMDVKEMYYIQETDELRVVFNDRSKTGSDYYLAGIDVSSGMILDAGEWDEEIGNVQEVMVSCCFDSEGVLWRDLSYDKVPEPDEATKLANHIVDLGGSGDFPYALSEELEASASYISQSWDIIAKLNETNYYLRSQYVSGDEGRLYAAVVMKNDTHVATPELDWNGGPILSLGPAGNIYQMVVTGGGVRIYRLGFAEFDAEDRNDMLVRQIPLSDGTLHNETATPMASYESFEVLDIAQMLELTADGKFAELVQEKGMALFAEYDNLEPAVLYKGAEGASYSCRMDYDRKSYELVITYRIDRDRPDVKTIQRIYVTALENNDEVTLYSADGSETPGDFWTFLIGSYGMEKQISFTLPEGFTLGAYNKGFYHYKASFLEGDIEAKPGDEFCNEWAITPGGIGIFYKNSMAYDEKGEMTGFAHWWTGTGSTWREENCEKVEGCFTSAVITEYYMSRFETPSDHYDFMQKYPELADQTVEASRFWYVFIGDATMEGGYVVFLNQEYFSKEDAIAFAKSVKPLGSANAPVEGDGQGTQVSVGNEGGFGSQTETETSVVLTMENFLRMVENGGLETLIEEQGMDLFLQYENMVQSKIPEGAVSATYTCELEYREKQYQLQLYYNIGKNGAEDKINTIYMIYPDSGEKQAIYTVRNNTPTVDLQEFVEYIDRANNLDSYITYQLPTGYNFTLGEFELPVGDEGPLYNGCLLEGDLEPLVSDGNNVDWTSAPGGIGTFTDWKRVTFENGEPVKFYYSVNHRGVIQDSFEKVDGCFTSALLAEVSFDLFTAATWEEYKTEHPEEAATASSQSKIWYVLICDESMDVGYVVFLNQAYFTKEEAIAFAQSIRPIEQ